MMKGLFNMTRCTNGCECAAILPISCISLYIVLFIVFSPILMVSNFNCWLVISIIVNGCAFVVISFYTTRKSQNNSDKNNYSFHGLNFTTKLHKFTPNVS